MANDTTSIHQFRALAAMEEAFRSNPDLAESALERMKTPLDMTKRTVAGIEDGTRSLGGDDPVRHFTEHWLSGAYFPSIDADTITRTLIEGFSAAIEAARSSKKHLVPIWVRGSDDASSRDFRVDHVETPTSVVVAIITPQPKR